jgi:hypothetical protein
MSIEIILNQDIGRREFLKGTGTAAIGIAGLLSGCATMSFKEQGPVIYPPAEGSKIQSPSNGCLIGFSNAHSSDETGYYEINLGKKPAIFAFFSRGSLSDGNFPRQAYGVAEKGIIPLVYTSIGETKLEDMTKGKIDTNLEIFASDAAKFGKRNGGFIFTPMFEMNIPREHSIWGWSGDRRNFQKAWKHLWKIFESKGANDYATWTIEYHVDFDVQGYWPGNQYVDCIGLSAYNRKMHSQYYGYRNLDHLISSTYHYFRTNHKEKPIIIEEFGTTIGPDQPRWLKDAYNTIKSFKGIKAALYWDNVNTELGDDHTLSKKSLKTLKEIFKDPYFIMAK